MNNGYAFLFSAATQRFAMLSDSHLLIHSYPKSYKIFKPLDFSVSPKELFIKNETKLLASISEGIFETARYLRYANSQKIK